MQKRTGSLLRIVAGILAITVCVDSVWAQGRPGGQGAPGGRGQRGGFGGGPGGGFGGGGFGGRGMDKQSLLGNEIVQKDLKLTDAQKKKIEDKRTAQRESMRTLFSDLRDLSEDERAKRFEELRKRGQDAEKEVLAILDEGQQERLGEIFVQVRGVSALMSDDISKELEITEPQKEKIREALESGRGGFDRELFASLRDLSAEEREKKMADIRKDMEKRREESEKKAIAQLSDVQKDLWELMQGEKFDVDAFQASMRQNRGGGAGFGGGRPGGGRPGGAGGGRPGGGDRPGRPGGDGNGDRPRRPNTDN